MELARLRLIIDSVEAASGAAAYEKSTQRVEQSTLQATASIGKMESALDTIGRQFKTMVAQGQQANQFLSQLAQTSNTAERSLGLLEIEAHKMDTAMRGAGDASIYTTRAIALQQIEGLKLNAQMDAQKASAAAAAEQQRALAASVDDTAKATANAERVVTALGLAFVSWKALGLANEVLTLGARFDTLGVAMNVVGQNAGHNYVEMNLFDQSLRKTGISMIESRNNLARMAAAQLDLNKATTLGRVAQDAAVIAGINSSDAFERLVQGIVAGQPRVLHTMGIFADFGRVEKEWADQHDRTYDSLSQVEKVNIRLNATLEEGAKRTGVYEAALGTAGKQMQSAKRYMEDLKVKVSETFQPEYTAGVFTYAHALKVLGDNAQMLGAVLTSLVAIGVATGVFLGYLKLLAAVDLTASMAPLLIAAAPVVILAAAFALLVKVVQDGKQEMDDFNKTIEETDKVSRALQAHRILVGYGTEQARKLFPDIYPPKTKDEDTENKARLQKFEALKQERTEELNKQTALNAAYGQSALALQVLSIQYDANIERAKNAKEHRGAELDSLNKLTDGLATQKIVAAQLAEQKQRLDAVRDAGDKTADRIRDAQQELALSTLQGDAFQRQRIENEALNSQIEARRVLDKALESADANQATAALAIYDNTLLGIQATKDLRVAQEALKTSQATDAIKDQRLAIEAENDALKSGASTRKDYQVNMEAQLATLKAYQTLTGQALQDRVTEIEGLRRAKVAHLELVAGIEGEDKAIKLSAATTKAYRQEMVAFGLTIQKDLLGSVKVFTDGGMQHLDKFLNDLGGLATKITEQITSVLAKMSQQWMDAFLLGDDDLAMRIDKQMSSLEKLRTAAAGVGIVVNAGTAGYQIGSASASGNKGSSALFGAGAGAAAGAELGSAVPGIGTAIGASVGAIAGMVGGILGAGHAADLTAKEMENLRKTLTTSLADIQATIRGDSMASVLAQLQAQFDALRKSAEDAYAYGENEAARKKALDQINTLQAQRQAQLIGQFWDGITTQLNAASGPAGVYANQVAAIEKQYRDNIASATTLHATTAQLADIEALRTKQLQALTDAQQAQAAQEALALKRANEDLAVRFLNASGKTEAGAAAAFQNGQTRELQDAFPAVRAQLQLVQLYEAAQNADKIATDAQVKAIQQSATATANRLDGLMKTAQAQLKLGQDAQKTAEQNLAATRKVVQSLGDYLGSLALDQNLSPLSAADRLAEAKKQLGDAYTKAIGGDKDAAGQLPGLANQYLTESRSYNASTGAYTQDYNTVKTMIETVKGLYGNQQTVEEQVLDAIIKTNDALTIQIQLLQDQKDAAATAAAAQIAGLQDVVATQERVTQRVVDAVTAQASASIAGVQPLLDSLAVLRGSVDAGTQSMIDRQAADLAAHKSAVQAAADAQIAAIRAGADMATQIALQQVTLVEESRVASDVAAITQTSALLAIRDGVDANGQRMINQQVADLEAHRKDAAAAAQREVDAINAGADTATQANNRQVTALEQQRVANDVAYSAQISTLAAVAGYGSDQVQALDAERKAQDKRIADQIAAINALPGSIGQVIVDAPRPPIQITVPSSGGGSTGNPGGGYGPPLVDANGNPIYEYADGGSFGGGLRLVGERGPELEVTGPSRIVDANSTRNALADAIGNSKDSVAALKAMQGDMRALARVNGAGLAQVIAELQNVVDAVTDLQKQTRKGAELKAMR